MTGKGMTRRTFLAAAAVGSVSARALVGRALAGPEGAAAIAGTTLQELRRVPRRTEIDFGPLGRRTIWTYDGQFPGPEIRVREGDRIRVVVENELPEPTTIHWHGVPVPNAMDGVPGLTQAPIAPGSSFTYEFNAEPAGSYLYHSHQGLQIDRGLVGALVIEERSPHVGYDRDYTLLLDDLLPGDPPEPSSSPRGPMGGGGMMGGMGGGMMGALGIPDYLALLVNGRPPADPPAFDVRRGERVRLRLMNPSGATTYRVAIAGHRMTVSHADGRPVAPVEVDALEIGMGERYDVIVDAQNSGAWAIVAAPLQGSPEPARAVLRYVDASSATPPAGQEPEGLRGGRLLTIEDLEGVEPDAPPGRVDRDLDLLLSGGMMSSAWTIGGQVYPDADPIEIRRGERVRFRMRNMSMASTRCTCTDTSSAWAGRGRTPCSCHRAWRDVVRVPGGQPWTLVLPLSQRVPHGEGMAREVRYVD
jgi:FtsP/CotA-like multicopper oxidase with cupredoxin domain